VSESSDDPPINQPSNQPTKKKKKDSQQHKDGWSFAIPIYNPLLYITNLNKTTTTIATTTGVGPA
jgi:hypothetical protein